MIVYRVTNVETGLKYIGQTTKSLKERWSGHTRKSSNYCRRLYNAIQKYGKEAFVIEQIAFATSLDELNLLEEQYIKSENTISPDGYNLLPGGRNKKHHPETCLKMSASRRGKKVPKLSGPRGPRLPEVGKAISIAKKGRPNGLLGTKKAYTSRPTHRKKIVAVSLESGCSFQFDSITMASKILCVQRTNIHKVLNKKRTMVGNYYFERGFNE